MEKILQHYFHPFHGEPKAFLILLAHHLHCYPAGKEMYVDKPQQRSVDLSFRTKDSNGKETLMSKKAANSHGHLHAFHAFT